MNTRFLFFLIIIFLFFSSCRDKYTVWLDELPREEIIDPYGPPKRNKSFAGQQLNVAGRTFSRGLGTHAPSELTMQLNKKVKYFEAWIGVDDYSKMFLDKSTRDSIKEMANYSYFNKTDHYDFSSGGSVVFRIMLDDKEIYASGVMTSGSSPKKVKVKVKGGERLSLIIDTGEDGAYRDLGNWMEARFISFDSTFMPEIYHHQENLMVNPVGYFPAGYKSCIKHNDGEFNYQVVDVESGNVMYDGIFVRQGGDFGEYLAGDFSLVETPGKYYVVSGDKKSATFFINDTVLVTPMEKHLHYITMQRSGHQEKGWITRSHLDDGVRDDNGKHQDVTGGWFDANDLRKPAKGNANLLYALAGILEKNTALMDEEELLDEIKWGNKFLFSMQEPKGYLMKYIGYTWDGYADNRWTDNIPGTDDDRTIITRPAEPDAHYFFILSQLKIYDKIKDTDRAYAKECLSRAIKCYNWTLKEQPVNNTSALGLELSAHVLMDRIGGNKKSASAARETAQKILESFKLDSVSGMYYLNSERHRVIFQTFGDIFSGLADFMETYPQDELFDKIYAVIDSYNKHYLSVLKEKNAFSILPWMLLDEESAGNHSINDRGYKYFLHVGMNQQLARNGFGLVKLNRVMNNREWLETAQSHLNWIYGVNPFYASTVTGIGYNQPDLFKTGASEFTPPTPEITGGVMTGIGGTKDDKISLYPGWWWTTEYWSPTVMSTILLVNELQDFYLSKH